MVSKQNKTVLAVLVLLVVIGAGYLLLRNGNQESVPTVPTPPVTQNNPTNPSWKTTTDSATGITFSYPETLSTEYISTSTDGWPPKVELVEEAFSCNPSGSLINQAGKTESITVNGHQYCLTREEEGAAGSIYTNYTYAFANGGDNTIVFTFTLRAPQCANYDEPKKTACSIEEASFSVDNLADQMAQSVKFQ